MFRISLVYKFDHGSIPRRVQQPVFLQASIHSPRGWPRDTIACDMQRVIDSICYNPTYTTLDIQTQTAHNALWRIRALTVRRPAYTFPGGEPRMRETIASRAILMFWNEPRIWILLYAETHSSV